MASELVCVELVDVGVCMLCDNHCACCERHATATDCGHGARAMCTCAVQVVKYRSTVHLLGRKLGGARRIHRLHHGLRVPDTKEQARFRAFKCSLM